MEQQPTCRAHMKSLGIIVVIPTYNNAGTIASVIADVKHYAEDILVVNDGSTDSTQQILASIEGIRIYHYAENRGKGHALKCGLKEAYALGFRYAITIDSDGQHYADDLPRFVERIAEKPDSLLIGARNLTAENMPSKNTFANRFSNFWYRVETGIRLTDTQSGYRLYPLAKLQNLRLITSRYEFEVEIIVRAAWRGVPVENIPIKVYYPPEGERVSHFRPLQDFTRISILNTFLVLIAFLCYYPWRFLRSLTRENIRNFFDKQLIHTADSNLRMAAAMGWGVFCGIIPLWGYQMIFAALSAHFLRLNKIVAVVFSNVSIPPMIPIILFGSLWLGARLFGEEMLLSIDQITFEAVADSLKHYLVGSCALASVAGLVVAVAGWIVMLVCRRKPITE
ncbi:MAG: DUF2062 domain-containing protein [Rikenellaceae bacterium]|nr:DUF2062 domain-containing protein [Rikenellaceae bacterium]